MEKRSVSETMILVRRPPPPGVTTAVARRLPGVLDTIAEAIAGGMLRPPEDASDPHQVVFALKRAIFEGSACKWVDSPGTSPDELAGGTPQPIAEDRLSPCEVTEGLIAEEAWLRRP